MFFSDKSKVLTIGIVSTVGVAVGSCLYALASKSFRWEAFRGVEDLRVPVRVAIGANVANVVLEVVFVWGLHWGVGGSATATVIVQPLQEAVGEQVEGQPAPGIGG